MSSLSANVLEPSKTNDLVQTHLEPVKSSNTMEIPQIKHSENIPLIDAESFNSHPPLAVSEVDDAESGDRQIATEPYPGIDDGFFIMNRAGETDDEPEKSADVPDMPRKRPAQNLPDHNGNGFAFPYAPGYDTEFGSVNPELESIPDVNVYQHKKTLAQGMMDLALFSANANQLRYVLESSSHPYYYPGIVLITISLMFQIAVGVGLIWNSRYNVKDKKQICIANKISNFTIIGIFMVTVINVFISAFGVASVSPVDRSNPAT